MGKPLNILIARTDALGDLLLSLPAIRATRESIPESRIHLICQSAYIPLLRTLLTRWGIHPIPYRKQNARGWGRFFSNLELDAVLFLHAPTETYWGAWRAGVPIRVGNYSKPITFATLSHGLRQNRSKSEKSEGQYARELQEHLANSLGITPASQPSELILIPIDEAARKRAQEKIPMEHYLVLHPGMRGSALNLSPRMYANLARSLRAIHAGPIFVSVGPQDGALAGELEQADPELRFIRNVTLTELAEIYRNARLVVAPSTGPLHLAHMVGTETLGLFSPIRAHHSVRWAPQGGAGRSRTLSPDVDCPAKRRCQGPSCVAYNCMESFPWEEQVAHGNIAIRLPLKDKTL